MNTNTPHSSTPSAPDPQTVANAVGEAMYARDYCAQHLGITLEAIAPNYARMTMTVRREMLNGFAILHGGILTTLADTAFAYACNSGNEMTVAAGIDTEFLAPAHEGDQLTAECRVVGEAGRTGVYDVTVTNQHGKLIAVMRGKSYRRKGHPICPVESKPHP